MSGKPPRRRNVISRRRTGCYTCRKRRLKCDEGKPVCHNCIRLSLPCEGYEPRVSFRDQTAYAAQKSNGNLAKRKRGPNKSRPSVVISRQSSDVDSSSRRALSMSPAISPASSIRSSIIEISYEFGKSLQNCSGDRSGCSTMVSNQVGLLEAVDESSSQECGRSDTLPVFDLFGFDELQCDGDYLDFGLVSSTMKSPQDRGGDLSTLFDCIIPDSPSTTEGNGCPPSLDEEMPSAILYPSDNQTSFSPSGQSTSTVDLTGKGTQRRLSLGTPNAPSCHTIFPALLAGSYKFPDDELYFYQIFDTASFGLLNILPLLDILAAEPVAPHTYSAILAVSALSISRKIEDRRDLSRTHAQEHSIAAMQGINETTSALEESRNTDIQKRGLDISWLLTMLLLANFELQRGSKKTWQSHLRAAGSYICLWYKQLLQLRSGSLLIETFSRMSLLLKIYNGDQSAMTTDTMHPSIIDALHQILRNSSHPRDRLLPLVDEVWTFELNYRRRPELESKWAHKSAALLQKLQLWQDSLSAEDFPVDTGTQKSVFFSKSGSPQNDDSAGLLVSALTFPRSSDPCTSAVDYANFLCTRMRAQTKYLPIVGRTVPEDADTTALTICRIAAGVSPDMCGERNAYGQGMMPAVAGAYWWTSDLRIRQWILGWLSQYPKTSEGMWNVEQTIRLIHFLDLEYDKRGSLSEWEIVAARIMDDNHDDYTGLDVLEGPPRPFKVVIHSRSKSGWMTEVAVVPSQPVQSLPMIDTVSCDIR